MEDSLWAWFSTWQVGAFLFFVGLCVGSFVNVCIYRLPAGKSIVWPASHCMACQAPIAWYDNIPVASYFVLRGRCRKCGAEFSARYMLVELATGLLWLGYWAAYFKAGLRAGADHPGVYLAHMALVSALVVSGVIDYDRKEIYTSVTNVALAIGLVGSLVWPQVQRIGAYDHVLPDWTGWERADAVLVGLVGAAVGSGLINLTRFLGTAAFRREAMGIGDVYLMAAIGGVLGWEAAVLVFLAAPFLGLPYGIVHAISGRRQEAGEGGAEEEPSPGPPRLYYGTFLATVAGFAMLLAGAAWAGGAWGTGPRLLLVGALVAFGLSFWFLRREEEAGSAEETPREEPQAAQREADRREVPYGPFLGMAACIVMLVQDDVVNYFRPGLEAMWNVMRQ
jgi:leader peptidase (prepilin peptidase)/N-methyltransferase